MIILRIKTFAEKLKITKDNNYKVKPGDVLKISSSNNSITGQIYHYLLVTEIDENGKPKRYIDMNVDSGEPFSKHNASRKEREWNWKNYENKNIFHEPKPNAKRIGQEAVDYARKLVKENEGIHDYNLLDNNCETFVNEITNGERKSTQIERNFRAFRNKVDKILTKVGFLSKPEIKKPFYKKINPEIAIPLTATAGLLSLAGVQTNKLKNLNNTNPN